MADLSELEHRITQALDRIGAGIASLERLAPPAPAAPAPAEPSSGAEDIAALKELLDAERAANAQLEERLKVLKDRQEREVVDLRSEVEDLRQQVDAVHGRNRSLKGRVEELKRALGELRSSSTSGTVTGEALNTALKAELDGVRALREEDRAELDAILGALEPLVKENANA